MSCSYLCLRTGGAPRPPRFARLARRLFVLRGVHADFLNQFSKLPEMYGVSCKCLV